MDCSTDLEHIYDNKQPGSGEAAGLPKPIHDAMMPGEKLLWSSRPSQHLLIFRPADDLYKLFVAIVILGVTIFAMNIFVNAISSGQSVTVSSPIYSGYSTALVNYLILLIVGLPFILIGFYFLFGHFIVDTVIRRRTYYALTDRRVLIWSNVWWRSLQSLPLEKIDSVDITLHWGGSGTLTFFSSMLWGNRYGARMKYDSVSPSKSYPYYLIPTLDHIADPKKVYDQILESQKNQMHQSTV